MTGEIRVTIPDIFIDKDGVWFADGRKVVHKKIFRLFCDSLASDGDSGYMLRIGDEKCPVRVEDAPFVVQRIFTDTAGGLKLMLNEGTVEIFQPETLTRRGDTAIYCGIRGGRLKARIGRSAYPDIISRIEYDPETFTYFFCHGGEKYPINDE